MEQAAFGIVDIQEFYDLETEDLIDGLLNDRNSDIVHKSIKKLTFPEIILISQAAGVSGYFDRKIEWLESAIPLAESEDDLKNLNSSVTDSGAEEKNASEEEPLMGNGLSKSNTESAGAEESLMASCQNYLLRGRKIITDTFSACTSTICSKAAE